MDGVKKGMEEVLAESLAALEQGEGLEAVLARYPESASELRPLLEMAAWMGSARAALEPRAGYVRASRARLVGRIAELGAAPPLSWWERLGLWWSGLFVGGRRTALQLAVVVVMLACLVLGSSGMAYASQGSLPGDALYPVKLGVEQVQLWANLDPVEEVRLHMRFSQERVEEIEELVKLGRYQDMKTALASYSEHVDQALLSLEELAALDPVATAELAAAMQSIYHHQARSLTLLAVRAGKIASAILESAASIAEEGAQGAERVEGEIVIAPRPTATGTPTATSPTSTPPLATPTPAPTNTKGVDPAGIASGTPLPTQTVNSNSPTSTQMPTTRVAPTRTPHPTHDSPTRPTATHTPWVTQVATATSGPTETQVTAPTASQTSLPSATATLAAPTSTNTAQPTSTVQSTNTAQPTNTPQPTHTKRPSPTPTQPPLPANTPNP